MIDLSEYKILRFKYPFSNEELGVMIWDKMNDQEKKWGIKLTLDGINDSVEDAKALLHIVKDVPCKFNLIPFNPFPNSGYKCSSNEQIRRFKEVLMNQDYIVTVRKTRGDDIDAACGQLAGQVSDKTKRSLKRIQITP